VSPALILLAAISLREIVFPGLLTLVGYLICVVPVGHLLRTWFRQPGTHGAFSPWVVLSTALFVGACTVTSAMSATWFDGSGRIEHPNVALWAALEAGLAALITGAATFLADAPLWLRRALPR
jgi:hypothetical protein